MLLREWEARRRAIEAEAKEAVRQRTTNLVDESPALCGRREAEFGATSPAWGEDETPPERLIGGRRMTEQEEVDEAEKVLREWEERKNAVEKVVKEMERTLRLQEAESSEQAGLAGKQREGQLDGRQVASDDSPSWDDEELVGSWRVSRPSGAPRRSSRGARIVSDEEGGLEARVQEEMVRAMGDLSVGGAGVEGNKTGTGSRKSSFVSVGTDGLGSRKSSLLGRAGLHGRKSSIPGLVWPDDGTLSRGLEGMTSARSSLGGTAPLLDRDFLTKDFMGSRQDSRRSSAVSLGRKEEVQIGIENEGMSNLDGFVLSSSPPFPSTVSAGVPREVTRQKEQRLSMEQAMAGLSVAQSELEGGYGGKGLGDGSLQGMMTSLKEDGGPMSSYQQQQQRQQQQQHPGMWSLLSMMDTLLQACGHSKPMGLLDVLSEFCDPSSVIKLGEGTYGEAFRGGTSADSLCFKIVPMDGDIRVNGELQKTSEEMLNEVLLTKALGSLRDATAPNMAPNFIETKAVRICRGKYEDVLVNAWEKWDQENNSENDHPMIFTTSQLYTVFVFSDGGADLEHVVLSNYEQARSILFQVVLALAAAENSCGFEHRDLHWGNILVATDEEDGHDCSYRINGEELQISKKGVHVSIIDFTLSRLEAGDRVLFYDLSTDPEIFEGPAREIQFDTYRRMLTLTEGRWEERFPKTNCLWLHYLADIILNKKSFKCGRDEKSALRAFRKRVLCYHAASAAVRDALFNGLWT
eukprot:TRINITY_DN32319_c0_g1_i1.p1 TRINITY_DN32319_c0_g1~~TRINITY_DN32319_c0_g1_i1.p1  ORF type:complete len:837 (+),score=156.81 TRINITY_DN32319_c0_g1_i1:272-2512(+)